jgi:hypothetical protein
MRASPAAVLPQAEPIEIDGYAQYCADRLRALWLNVAEPSRAEPRYA